MSITAIGVELKCTLIAMKLIKQPETNEWKLFFDDLGIPKPDINLGAGSASDVTQTAKIMMEFEHLRKRYWGQHIWARGYFAVTVGNLNEKQVQEYIENQEAHHKQDNFDISSH